MPSTTVSELGAMLPETSDFITSLFICSWQGKFSLFCAYPALHLFQSRSPQCSWPPLLHAATALTQLPQAPRAITKPQQYPSRASKVCIMHPSNLHSACKERSLVHLLSSWTEDGPLPGDSTAKSCCQGGPPGGVLGSLWICALPAGPQSSPASISPAVLWPR